MARAIAARTPPQIINDGATMQAVHRGPAPRAMFLLGAKFEDFEYERQDTSRTALIDFRLEPGERTDTILARFEIARLEVDLVGSSHPGFPATRNNA
eukprot:5324474-Pyramimonas_sp.AAC.1